jgi:hypothetical protein
MIPVKLQLVLFVMLIFLIVGSPMTYQATDVFIGKSVGMPFVHAGIPTTIGLIAHALVAGGLTWMYLLTFRV